MNRLLASTSLFEPKLASPMQSSAEWLTSALLGSAAITLCVLAVAFVGLMMLTGRLHVKQGLRVALGCFVLLGAPVVAAALIQLGSSQNKGPEPTLVADAPPADPRGDLPPADYDPYAGASLRRD